MLGFERQERRRKARPKIEMAKALPDISLLFKLAFCESYADIKLSINWSFDGTLNFKLVNKNLIFIIEQSKNIQSTTKDCVIL